ncbi:cysteine synthase [Candidatus Woesearchaeota archaeon]|nr:cysteine synthase [Candidatus Woesearchaeota archaeon]
MRYGRDVLELVGNTPLVQLNSISKGSKGMVLAKLEFLNPGGSVKDRIGVSMVLDAEKRGLLKPGGTIVEPTSGNTGMGLALVATLKGYKCIFVMPEKMSIEKERLLRAFGAEVVRTPTDVAPDDPRSNYKVAERLAKEIPNAFSPNQYRNPTNPLAHYQTTGPELWRDTEGKLTHFVAGIGTGGTISGTARYLKEKNPKVKVIGADPEGSIFHDRFHGRNGRPYTYKVEGIGEDFIPDTTDLKLLDGIEVVSDRQAFLMARRLVREEGLLVGGSSGAAMEAASRVAKTLKKGDVLVVLLPDGGRSYLSTFLDDGWMKENRFL